MAGIANGFFEKLGTPAPSIQAPFVAGLEFVGGLLLILGAGTRLFGLMLGLTMIVALMTAIDLEGKGLQAFFYLPETLLVLLCFWFFARGGGKASIDHILATKLTGGDAVS